MAGLFWNTCPRPKTDELTLFLPAKMHDGAIEQIVVHRGRTYRSRRRGSRVVWMVLRKRRAAC